MTEQIKLFIDYLTNVKKLSKNTEISYRRDLLQMAEYLETQGIKQIEKVTKTSLNSYVLYLEKQGKAPTTVSRTIASMKAFFHYAFREEWVKKDPSELLKAPRVERKLPEILSAEQMQRLLAQPSRNVPKELRDKAMLELMYATGIRVSELIHLTVDDINLAVGIVNCRDEKKERVVPFGKNAKTALVKYLESGREHLLKSGETDLLFMNCNGKEMSRQGFWKILKHYGEMAEIPFDITPHTLRHTFAAHMIGNGADVRAVQTILGHAGIASTQMYATLNGNTGTHTRK